MCEVALASSYDDLSDIFLKIFDTRQKMEFFRAIIETEVAQTTNESELFRGNNFWYARLTSNWNVYLPTIALESSLVTLELLDTLI